MISTLEKLASSRQLVRVLVTLADDAALATLVWADDRTTMLDLTDPVRDVTWLRAQPWAAGRVIVREAP